MKAVVFGAGNIGRGFLGELFSKSGYHTTFVDVNEALVKMLNEKREYPITILENDGDDEYIVKNIDAVLSSEKESVVYAVKNADILVTSVGVNYIKYIIDNLREGLLTRWESGNFIPLNMIICENMIDAKKYIRNLIKETLDKKWHETLDETFGLVAASVGRMVPIQTDEMKHGNPLRICVEKYNHLPVDKNGFKGEIPNIYNIDTEDTFDFHVEAKLFIHNMGHSLSAYFARQKGIELISKAMLENDIRLNIYEAMICSAAALSQKYNVSPVKCLCYVDDLIKRFQNAKLGDTTERVGRDLMRKLSPNDRLIGTLKLCIEMNVRIIPICRGIAASLSFGENIGENPLTEISHLNENSKEYNTIMSFIK